MSEEQKQKARERAKLYYQKNKEKVLARQKKYAKKRYNEDEEYRKKCLENHKRYEEKNYEKVKKIKREAQKKYYQSHKEYYNNYSKQYAKNLLDSKDKEISRLNNIIDELEKYILNHYIVGHTIQNASLDDIINKLKELKGDKDE